LKKIGIDEKMSEEIDEQIEEFLLVKEKEAQESINRQLENKRKTVYAEQLKLQENDRASKLGIKLDKAVTILNILSGQLSAIDESLIKREESRKFQK
jgi:hypothetical protein